MAHRPLLHVCTSALLAATLLVGAAPAAADAELRVVRPSAELSGSSEFGSVEIEGVGAVRLHARRQGTRLILHASGPDGRVLGRGETTIGLSRTPIFVRTPEGHAKITVLWGASVSSGGE